MTYVQLIILIIKIKIHIKNWLNTNTFNKLHKFSIIENLIYILKTEIPLLYINIFYKMCKFVNNNNNKN